jgi:hypothetical protein
MKIEELSRSELELLLKLYRCMLGLIKDEKEREYINGRLSLLENKLSGEKQ